MWDTKRKLIWIVGGVLMGTFVAYSNAFTGEREFSIKFFVFMETAILLIMAGLFYLYSRKN